MRAPVSASAGLKPFLFLQRAALPDPGLRKPLFVAAFWGAIVLWLAAWLFMSTVPMTGDEVFYYNGAARIAGFLTGSGTSLSELRTALVGFGWFMPGTSIALTPLFLIDADPPIVLVRLFACGLSLFLWLWTLREVFRAFGRNCAVGILFVPGLVLGWQQYAATIWGDLPAGLLLTVVMARAWRMGLRAFQDTSPTVGEFLALNALLAAATYVRGNLLYLTLSVQVFLLALWAISGRWESFPRRAGRQLAGVTLYVCALLPWSLTASAELGARVLTTSTLPLSIGLTFGNPEDIIHTKQPGVSAWRTAAILARKAAAKDGISELEEQKRMADYALRDLTLKSYAAKVRANYAAFLFKPTGYLLRFVRESELELDEGRKNALGTLITVATDAFYYPALLVLILANLIVVARDRGAQLLSLCLKMFTIGLFMQPFVHPCGARYWPTFAPLMGVALGFVAGLRPPWRGADPLAGEADASERILKILQASWVAFLGAAALTLALL